jgi:tetratricopeptide (TPR) repeat protein
VLALERAVALNPVYANARYFLGLSYSKLGKVKEAITQFEQISATNPDNSEVKTILSNLRAGKAPLPSNDQPEKGKTPPVKDKAAKTATGKGVVTP